jgi:uncharacterized protein YjbI with pentapeptide repeats
MAEEQAPRRPTRDDDRAGWRTHWAARRMPWRTEPEIDEARQRYLAERRAIVPDVEQGIYPFKDVEPELTRADIEWLLAAQEFGGMRGPVDWADEHQRGRDGLDLRGAWLRQADLSGLPLARMLGGLRRHERERATGEQRAAAAIHLERANLYDAHLEDAVLSDAHLEGATLGGTFGHRTHLELAKLIEAHLEGADCSFARLDGATLIGVHLDLAVLYRADLERAELREAQLGGATLTRAHLEGADLSGAVLGGADLRGCFFDSGTDLNDAAFFETKYGSVRLGDVRWGGANLALVRWSNRRQDQRNPVKAIVIGDEDVARNPKNSDGTTKTSPQRLADYENAVRANRQLSKALRDQELNDEADRFAYRARVLERQVLRRQRDFPRLLVWYVLDVLAGYGYRTRRTFAAYLLAVFGFGIAYYGLSRAAGPALSPVGALVFSVTSFHGRGFFPGGLRLDDPLTVLAALEAFVGLIIEVSFIATFTQRFFAR